MIQKLWILLPLMCIVTRDGTGRTLAAEPPPAPDVAHFRFNGDGQDVVMARPEFELANVRFTDEALQLNGKYEFTDEGGFRAVCKTPGLSYRGFSVAVRFNAESFEGDRINILTGGDSYRWFGLHRVPDGDLTVTFNNQEYSRKLDGVRIGPGEWTVVACSVDIPGRRVAVSVNGAKPVDFDLPADFKLAVIEADPDGADKVWTFTDYSNGQVFHGLIDELVIYGKPLPSETLERLLIR
jgi:hypothetical protein